MTVIRDSDLRDDADAILRRVAAGEIDELLGDAALDAPEEDR